MAAPYPPQGNQTPHTERPLKIYAEPYHAAAALPVHAVTELLPLYPAASGPYADLGTTIVPLHEGDVVISNRYTGAPVEVISAEEFTERFGPSEL